MVLCQIYAVTSFFQANRRVDSVPYCRTAREFGIVISILTVVQVDKMNNNASINMGTQSYIAWQIHPFFYRRVRNIFSDASQFFV